MMNSLTKHKKLEKKQNRKKNLYISANRFAFALISTKCLCNELRLLHPP